MSTQDIRWIQRLSNYRKALAKLHEAVHKIEEMYPEDENGNIHDDTFLKNIIKDGLIHRFEYTHELAWNVMKDFLENAGNSNIYGSKDATREAFSANLISDGEVWMDMIKSRNKTSHTYNEATADEIFSKIMKAYINAFIAFDNRMDQLSTGKHSS